MNGDFESKLLYEQSSVAEEGARVLSTVYAVLWLYPGAITKTTARVRLSFVYQEEGSEIFVLAGTIEKWRNEGWSVLDEFFDSTQLFSSAEDARSRLLAMAQSFLTGVPLNNLDDSYNPSDDNPISSPKPEPAKKPDLTVINYEERKNEIKNDSEKSKKDTDFDYV